MLSCDKEPLKGRQLSTVIQAAEEHEWKRRRRGSKSEEEEDEPMAADAWPVTG